MAGEDDYPGPLTVAEIRRRDAIIANARRVRSDPAVPMTTGPAAPGAEPPPEGPPPAPGPVYGYQPNPGLPNYQPNPGLAGKPIPKPEPPKAAAAPPAREGRMMMRGEVPIDPSYKPPTKAFFERSAATGESGPAEESIDENPPPGPRGSAAAGGLVQVSPGGRTPSSWTTQTQEGLKLSDDTKRLAEGAETSKFDAANQHLEADQAAANAELDILRRHELVQQARSTELQQRADRQRAQYEAQLAKLNDMTTAVSEDRIDNEQWFKSRTAGQKFAAGLGIALGAVSQAMLGRHGTNPGLEMVRQGIGEEIDAQKANAQLRRSKLDDQRSLLGQMARTFGDERTAEDAAWIVYLERAKTQLAAAAAAAKSDFAKAKYADVIAQVKDEIAGRREKWDQMEQDKVTRVQHDVNAPPTYAGAAGGALNATDEKANQELTERLTKSGIPGMRNDVNRLLAVIPKTGEVPGVTSTGAGTASMLGGTAEKVYGAGYNILGSTQGQEIRQAAAVLFNRQLKDESGAAVSDQELERQKAAFYGARDARSARAAITNYANRLNELEATIRSGFKGNVNDVQQARKNDESRRLQREKKFTGPKAE